MESIAVLLLLDININIEQKWQMTHPSSPHLQVQQLEQGAPARQGARRGTLTQQPGQVQHVRL